MSRPSLLMRLFPRKRLALRVSLAAFAVAVAIILIKNATELYLGQTGTLFGRFIGDLPYAVIPVVVLYFVYSRYVNTKEALDSKLRSQAQLVEYITDAVIGTDLEFVVTSWNKAAELIYGYSAEEAIGKSEYELLVTEFVGVTRDKAIETLVERGAWKGETVQSRKHGNRINVLAASAVVRNADGTPIGYVSINSDITERLRAEEALMASEQRYRFLFENSPISLFEIDISPVMEKLATLPGSAATSPPETVEGRMNLVKEILRHLKVVGVNSRAVEAFEADSKEELISRLGEIMTDDTIMKLAEGMVVMMTGSTHFVGETEARTLKGRQVFIGVDWSLVVGAEAKSNRYVVGLNDITQLKRAHDELRALATFPEENPSPVMRLTAEGRVAYANGAGKEVLKAWGCGIGGVAPESWRETVKDVLATKASKVVELEYGPVFYSFSVSPVSELGYVNLYARDVTEREAMVRALKESEEKFRSMFESSGVGIGIASPDGKILEANPALLSMVGYTEEEARRSRLQDHIHPDDFERITEARQKMIAAGTLNLQSEARFRHKDGHYIWMVQTASSVRDLDGRPLYTVAILEDITARKAAQEALRESEERFRIIFESAAIGIGIASPEGYNLASNETFRKMLGFTEAELTNSPILEHIAPEDREKLLLVRAPLLEGKTREYQGEVRFITKGGRQVWVNLTASLVRDANGKPLYIASLFEDITEKKRAEEALRESEEKFRKAFVVGADAFYVATKEGGRISEINDQFVEIFGYAKEEVVGKTSLELGLYADPSDREKMLEGLNSKGYVRNLEINGRRKGGEVFPILLSVSVLQAQGESLIVGAIRDITELRNADEQLKRYSTRLEETVRERTGALEEEHDRLLRAERMATVGRISTQVAHDIRNPLAAINTGLYYLKSVVSKEHGKKIDETVKSMEGSVAHANNIMEDLLDFSRARQFESAPVNLGPVVAEALKTAAIPVGVKVIPRLDPDVRVMGDAPKLVRVFVNLLRNAVDAMPHGGTLTVSCEEERGMAIVEVADTGSGVDAANLPKLFTPFFTTKARGLGMGLAICKEVVEAHGGTIKAASRVNRGTTFTISLPITKSE